MRKNTLLKKVLLVTLVVAGLTLIGCGKKTETPAEKPAEAPAETDADADAPAEADAPSGDVTIAMLPKFKGENYFDACKKGAEEAAAELGITLLYDGPPQDQATNQKQVDILEGWIAQNVSAIVVSPNDPNAIAPTLKKAQDAGIPVITFDADADPDARDIFVNQIVAEGIAKGLLDGAANDLKAKGYGGDKKANIAIVSSTGTDANQLAWEAAIHKLLETDDFNFMQIQNQETDVYYPGTDEAKVNSECAVVIGRMGEGEDKIQAALALSSMSAPALGAQYQSAADKPNPDAVTMTGIATPNGMKTYIKDESNPMNSGVLWNCMDLGYLAVQTAYQLADGTLTPQDAQVEAGRLGAKDIADREIVLGDALVFDITNVDEFDY